LADGLAAHQLFFHLTWSTLDRRPMIDPPTRAFLEEFLRRSAIKERVEVIELAILATHVHVVIRTTPRIDLSRLVQMMKGGSSYAGSRVPGNRLGLRWTREYSATTVSPRLLPEAVRYLQKQNARHPMERLS
jgi:REP element-mobilizing transposase RayT